MAERYKSRNTGLYQIEVLAVETLTPHMQRITAGGAGAAELLKVEGVDAPAAWVKVFIPSGEGRAYTIRSIDRHAGTLNLDFVLHGVGAASGPAAAWARQAKVGEQIGLSAPRSGEYALPDDAGWIVLGGDATALPAMHAIAKTLPAGISAEIYAEIHSPADQQTFTSLAELKVFWLYEHGKPGLALLEALISRPLPAGAGYVWIAGESTAIRALRQNYLHSRDLERSRLSAMGYWKTGEAAHRDPDAKIPASGG